MCYTTTHYPPPPPPPSDPLIHSISSHHHHQHHHTLPQIHHTLPQNHHTHSYPPPPPPQIHQNHHLFQKYRQHEDAQENPPPPLNPTVSSLIHRIAALESSLLRRRKQSSRSSSLRDAAARTIQTHFRAFLVRRSVTLRHLKDLAYIKSALNHLKTSVSKNTQFDSRSISRESMSLLIKLDSIQGSDPMIRDGKRSIGRELIRFMEVIDEMCTEMQVITVKNVRFGKNGKKSGVSSKETEHNIKASGSRVFESLRKPGVSQIRLGDLRKSVGKSQQNVKKNVRFDEDGNVYRLFKRNHNQGSSDGSDSSHGDGEEVEEIGVSSKETEVEEDDSSEMSENEMDPRKNLRARIHHTTEKNPPDQEDEDEDDDDDEEEEEDSFVFSAPLPAKMEY